MSILSTFKVVKLEQPSNASVTKVITAFSFIITWLNEEFLKIIGNVLTDSLNVNTALVFILLNALLVEVQFCA